MTDLSIGNDPYQKLSGTVFTMVVNKCELAKEVDLENGLESYNSDVECSTDLPESEIDIRQKLMASSFSP